MALTALILDGAGSAGRTSGVVDPCVERLRWKTGCTAKWVPWAASLMGVGGSLSWPEASRRAVNSIAAQVRATDNDIILIGYSAGCRPVREFLEKHPEFHNRIAAVALMADAWQPASRQQYGVPNPSGHGIMGSDFGPLRDRTYWVAAPGDPIPRCARDSLLRYLPAVADAVPGQMLATFVDKAHRGRLQLIPFLGLPIHEWLFGLGPRIERSIREAEGYLTTGRHTRGYTEPFDSGDGDRRPLAHRLADSVAWKVRNQ
ncbi:alpha/beta hydrolase [Dietzia sp. ANT_WB102]|uniref:alpha/beta hydrolase n=1 Tax=Dietzia sp. ANT_WB102 TaxID=2597345 RepID=UPI0011EC73A7|nr:alpha/beta hydrolase [Dietzia sp. ANT_WB102]KAA0916471.1 alpha/beta hydrolase [Dietzia sp. ANT_WB102]